MLGGFKITCNYCGEKASVKDSEQYKDMLDEKSDAKFLVSKHGMKCKKCGNKVTEKA